MLDRPHFDLPFRFNPVTNLPAEVEQGSLQEVSNSAEVVLRFRKGEREELPEFGIEDPTFSEGDIDLESIRNDVLFWEPRAKAQFTEAYGSVDAGVRNLTVKVGL